MKCEIPGIRYVVWKQARFKEDGAWVWKEPYIYAITSNSASAIELCRFATEENPNCRMWKMGINADCIIPDPARVGPNSRDYFRREYAKGRPLE